MKYDSRVESPTRAAHVLLDDLSNHAHILNDVLALDLAILDSVQDALGAGFERKTSVAIPSDLVLLGKLRLGLDECVACASDGSEEGIRVEC